MEDSSSHFNIGLFVELSPGNLKFTSKSSHIKEQDVHFPYLSNGQETSMTRDVRSYES